MELKYKVGDKVKIRSDLKVDKFYKMNGVFTQQGFVHGMKTELGKTREIASADNYGYTLKGVNYYWTDEMFEEKVEEKFLAKFKVGDRVKIICSNVGGSTSPDLGRIATISTVRDYEGRLLDYEVDFGEVLSFTYCGEGHAERHFRYYREVELEKVEEKKMELPAWRSTPGKYSIMIHSDGDVTTLELHDRRNGRVKSKVSVKRYFKDDFDLLAAARYGLDKLADDLTKKEEEETFKRGDIVEVLSAKAHGLPVGIRGEVVEKVGDNTWVVDLKFKYESTHSCDGRLSDQTGLYIIGSNMKKVK